MMLRLLPLLSLCIALAWGAPGGAAAQDVPVVAEPSANDLREFSRLLADPRIQNWLVTQASTPGMAPAAPALGLREEMGLLVDRIRLRMDELRAAWSALPLVKDVLRDRWQTELTPGTRVRGLTFVMIFLFVGAGMEWLYRQYTQPICLRIELTPVHKPLERVTAALKRAVIAAAGLGIFSFGSIGVFAAFTWTALQQTLVLNMLLVVVAVRVVHRILAFLLAPRVPELRLVPMSNTDAKYMVTLLLCLTTVLVMAASLTDVFIRITGGDAHAPHAVLVSLALAGIGFVATVIAIIAGFGHMARHHGGSHSTPLWRLYLIGLSVLVLIAVVLDQGKFAATLALTGMLWPGLRLLRLWVDRAFDQAAIDRLAPMTEAQAMLHDEPTTVAPDAAQTPDDTTILPDTPLPDPFESYRPVARRLAQFVALFVVGGGIALIWGINIFERAAAPTFSGRVLAIAIDSAVAILIADLIWVWASSAIDRRLSAYVPPRPGQAPGPEARMATLLPLLRVVLMVTLLAMVTMSILSSLGVNIAPIIAGAGVVGIAIGFGAQSLVKDVVSGIFFLVDDAFRVGEYVEIDQLRGTVEKISIRSLQIRHHRGAVHTLPFGELRHLTNHSRDWVIMKLEFRVPFDTDLMLVKKIIKKIGAQMKEHPEYGDSILDTLKSQGVRRMEEFNMVVGVKFMTRPGEQWLVRRDAYQMVRDAFDENGIRMAERNVKVEVANADTLTPAEREAVAGAAQNAIETRVGPPAPIPDEP